MGMLVCGSPPPLNHMRLMSNVNMTLLACIFSGSPQQVCIQ